MIWFAGFALVAVTAFFYPLSMGTRARLLFMALPTAAGAMAGYVFGGRVRASSASWKAAAYAGIRVGIAAFVIFCALFAVLLPFVEPLWKPGQTASLFVLTVIFGAIMAAPVVVVTGGIAGVGLYALGQWWKKGSDREL